MQSVLVFGATSKVSEQFVLPKVGIRTSLDKSIARGFWCVTTQASWYSVVGLGQPSPLSLFSHRQKEKFAPCVLQYDMCSKHASLSELTQSPVRSSAVPRSVTAGNTVLQWTTPHQSGSHPASFICERDHSLLRQISGSELYPTVQILSQFFLVVQFFTVHQTIRNFTTTVPGFDGVLCACGVILILKVLRTSNPVCLVDATLDGDFMYFHSVLIVKIAASISPDLHAVSCTMPVILLWCFTSTIPATPFPCVLRSVSFAALDHLRGEKAFSLCRNLRQFPMLKSLCVTWFSQRVHYLDKEAGQENWNWLVVASVTRCVVSPSLPGSSTSAADKALLQGFKTREIASWQLSCMSPLHSGRLRRPSTLREKEALDTVRGRLGLAKR